MNRVAELWAALTDDEQDQVAAAMRTALRDRGEQLVLAIAREARPEPEAEPPSGLRCHLCGLPADGELIPRWDFQANTLLLLCPRCYRGQLLAHQEET